jgi:hypothetical protein
MFKKAIIILALAMSIFTATNTSAIDPTPDCYPCPDVR